MEGILWLAVGAALAPAAWLAWHAFRATRYAIRQTWPVVSGGLNDGYGWWNYLWATPALFVLNFLQYLVNQIDAVTYRHDH